METWSEDHPDRAVVARDVPRYSDLVKHGLGFYLRDPRQAAAGRVVYE